MLRPLPLIPILLLPALAATAGWFRIWRYGPERTWQFRTCLVALALAATSVVIAAGFLYAASLKFRFANSISWWILDSGPRLGGVSFLCGVIGMWKPSRIRLPALLTSIGVNCFWIICANI